MMPPPAAALLPLRRRYQHSAQMIKTNFAFGDDAWGPLTTYDKDYTGDSSLPMGISAEPSCRDTHMQRLLDLSKLPVVLKRDETDETGNAKPDQQGKMGELQERRKSQRRTNFQFGNDPPNRSTAYAEFAEMAGNANQRRRACSPPSTAEILPPPKDKTAMYKRSTLRSDYNYFGPHISDAVYNGRADHLQEVKTVNTFDSVAYSFLGKRRRMMTRSMVDYRNPLERVRGNLKVLMAHNISPAVRMDSIWRSVNCGDVAPISENRSNFTWPHAAKREKLPPVGR